MDRVSGEHSMEEGVPSARVERKMTWVIQQGAQRGQRSRGRRGPPVTATWHRWTILPTHYRGEREGRRTALLNLALPETLSQTSPWIPEMAFSALTSFVLH